MSRDPLAYFQAGQKIGSANAPSVAGPNNVLDMFKTQAEGNMKMNQLIGVKAAENMLPQSPLEQAQTENYKSLAGMRQSGRSVFMVNPVTGELSETIANVPQNSRIFKQETPNAQESASLSDIDEVLNTLPRISGKLKQNPLLAATGKIPMVDPSYKADYDYLTKTLASVVGGKNLTLPERQIVQTNLPSWSDIGAPDVLQTKLGRIERVMRGAKGRMTSGSFTGRADTAQDATREPAAVTREQAIEELRRRGHNV